MAESHPIAAPPWFDDADLDFNEMVFASGMNRNTLTSYQRLLIASDRRCGKKLRGLWFFSARELYTFYIVWALARGKIPISIEILLNVWDFSQQAPTGPFVLPSEAALTMVSAPTLWNAAINMMTDVRARKEAGENVIPLPQALHAQL